MEPKIIERRELIEKRILASVEEYCTAFQKPMPMKALSAKFARSAEECGGFNELIDKLKNERKIQVYLHENTAAKTVLPGKSKIIPENGVKI